MEPRLIFTTYQNKEGEWITTSACECTICQNWLTESTRVAARGFELVDTRPEGHVASSDVLVRVKDSIDAIGVKLG